jgi:hypothetical protein
VAAVAAGVAANAETADAALAVAAGVAANAETADAALAVAAEEAAVVAAVAAIINRCFSLTTFNLSLRSIFSTGPQY